MIPEIKYLLLVSSITYLLSSTKLFAKTRDVIHRRRVMANIHAEKTFAGRMMEVIDEMVNCVYCLGFWLGLVFYPLMFTEFSIFNVICYPLICAITTRIIVGFTQRTRT